MYLWAESEEKRTKRVGKKEKEIITILGSAVSATAGFRFVSQKSVPFVII